MSSLRPCRMPHTLAPVWELQSQCHSVSAWLPWASQSANVGMSPSRTARRTVSKPRPSTCRNSTPGGRSSGVVSVLRRAARRKKISSSSRPSRLDTSAATADIATTTTTAVPRPAITTPGITNERASSAAPISRNEPMPSV